MDGAMTALGNRFSVSKEALRDPLGVLLSWASQVLEGTSVGCRYILGVPITTDQLLIGDLRVDFIFLEVVHQDNLIEYQPRGSELFEFYQEHVNHAMMVETSKVTDSFLCSWIPQ